MANHLTPSELADELHMKRQEVIGKCMEMGVPIFQGRIDKTLFLAEAVQAGIFSLRNVPQQELDPLLGIGCPTIVFPYLRETISDLVVRAGFPPVLLSPVSFEALYMQRLQGTNPQGQQGQGPQIEVAR